MYNLEEKAAGTRLTCVYCGKVFSKRINSNPQALRDHTDTCIMHPLREAEATIEALKEALFGVVMADNISELRIMETCLENPIKTQTLDAVRLLIKLME